MNIYEHMAVPFDVIYEVCRWDLGVYRAVIYNRAFHEYMTHDRLLRLQADHTYLRGGGYYLCGKLHREDGPAFTAPGGFSSWFRYGKRHREGGPAIIYWDNSSECRRDGRPAVKTYTCTIKWYRNGNLHRDDGPAIIWYDGKEEWWQNGLKVAEE